MRYIICFTLVLLTACTSTMLIMPEPIKALDSKAETREAIIDGMASRGWMIQKEEKERILASINVREHAAKTWIDYSTSEIVFTYAGSTNLGCVPKNDGNGCETIHSKYNKWLANLRLDIGGEITRRLK